MVTFTKAAVAELEGRIRDFVRSAWTYGTGHPIEDQNIIRVVEEAKKLNNSELITDRLHKAMLLMDDASIRTIHSFCQQVLSEYAFETGQLFQAELISDEKEIIREDVNKFWRKFVTGLDSELYGELVNNNFTRKALVEAVQFHNGGKRFAGSSNKSDLTSANFIVRMNELFKDGHDQIKQLESVFKQKLQSDIPLLVGRMSQAKRVNEKTKAILNKGDVDEVFEWLSSKNSSQYFQDIAQDYVENIEKLKSDKKKLRLMVVSAGFEFALRQILSSLAGNRVRKNQITYNELISRLHTVVTGQKSDEIKEALRKKYKAVFVDEFQDTDRQQYEIFKELFLKQDNTVFFIGDPKQSIYAFRQADVFTYFRASQEVDHCYSMNVNFRSSTGMVHALNHFFLPNKKFDTFGFGESEHQITYQHVDSGPEASKGALIKDNKEAQAIMIFDGNSKDELYSVTANTIAHLLSDTGWKLKIKDTTRNIVPGDIGVLVRNKNEAAAIRKALGRFRIPAVTIDDTKILETDEAREILYILEAVLNPTLPGLHKALMTTLTQMTIEKVLSLEEDWLLKKFRDYQKKWMEKGVFVMLTSFLSDFRVHAVLMKSGDPLSARMLSNIGQLTELLHKMEKQQNYSPSELVVWLQKGINEGQMEGDEYELRIESDEASVNVLTIHRSKGLEYNIVFAPFLDLTPSDPKELAAYRDPMKGLYFFQNSIQLDEVSNQWYLKEQEQENRRLIYVALTRAKYGCILMQNHYHGHKDSSLKYFLQALEATSDQTTAAGIALHYELPEIDQGYRYQTDQSEKLIDKVGPSSVAWEHSNWKKLSYSYLTEKQSRPSIRFTRDQDSNYDRFIFRELPKGAVTGNLLHYIFEHIDFTNPAGWERVVKMAMQRLSYDREDFQSGILEMLKVVTSVMLPSVDCKLSSVGMETRLNELEFDFNVMPFHAADLTKMKSLKFPMDTINERNLEGVMNGKIDLFFKAGNKYYVLDWKSNFLGDTVEDYEGQGLLDAMTAGNYHLQYHLYSLAVYKYLRSRLSDFDYERDFGGVVYIFLRGVRLGRESGLFLTRPDLKVVMEMEELFGPKTLAD